MFKIIFIILWVIALYLSVDHLIKYWNSRND